MGLDITSYSNVEFIETMTDWDAYDEKYWHPGNYTKIQIVSFKEHALPFQVLASGSFDVYRYEDSFSFRAGSYSGYNEWRNYLCWMTNQMSPGHVWQLDVVAKDLPFYWLINFSDCEGVIGTDACRILARQFKEYRGKLDLEFIQEVEDRNWFMGKYIDWQQAFELAANNGFVSFH